VVTIAGGLLASILTISYQYLDRKKKREISLKDKKYQALTYFADKFEAAVMILNYAMTARISKVLCFEARKSIAECETEVVDLKSYEGPICFVVDEAVIRSGGNKREDIIRLLEKNEKKFLERENKLYELYLGSPKAKSLLAQIKAMFGNEVNDLANQMQELVQELEDIEENRLREKVFKQIEDLFPQLLIAMGEEIKVQ
jgi:hypothetical protein